MAPVSSSETLPLGARFMLLVKTLKFGWFAGHCILLLSAIRYALSYMAFDTKSSVAQFSYRTVFLGATVTYGIIVYKQWNSRVKKPGGPLTLIAEENVQYLSMAVVSLLSYQVPISILPFATYSVFHIANYSGTELIPTLQPLSLHNKVTITLAEYLVSFFNNYHNTSMIVVAYLEILLWFRIFGSALLFQKGSWLLLFCYTTFIRARHTQSKHLQSAVSELTIRVDSLVKDQRTPQAVKEGWETIQYIVIQLYNASNVFGGSRRKA